MEIAIVGATGLVGSKMLEVIKERNLPITRLIPVASKKSIGKTISFQGEEYPIVSIEDAIEMSPDIALFSAGGTISKAYARSFEEKGTWVIDNSSAWRMEKGIPLVVPEINPTSINTDGKIIANPNCSTIQMVVALGPLHRKYPIKRLLISTYQSVSGTGYAAVDQMNQERDGDSEIEKVYPHTIDKNCLPHCDVFMDNGYTKEEMKLVEETRKILGSQDILISATAVRVPVDGGHSESVNVEFSEPVSVMEVKTLLSSAPGVTVLDRPEKNEYPMPLFAKNTDEVYVGRIRQDLSNPNAINLWIVSDNLRKGAATNAVQIAEYLVEQKLVQPKSTQPQS